MKNLFLSALFAVLMFTASGFSSKALAEDGHYEARYQTVLVCAGHYEARWVAPLYRCSQIIRGGYWVNVYMPPQYAVRTVQVWVPDAPRYVVTQPAPEPLDSAEPVYERAEYVPERECHIWNIGSFFINIKGVFGLR